MKVLSSLTAVACLAVGSMATASINYGDFIGADVDFIGVTESSPTDSVPLFGQPNVFGNNLSFLPASNFATAENGSSDETIGILTMTVNAKNNQEIRGVSILNLGTTNILGQTTSSTYTAFETDLLVTVTASGDVYNDSASGVFTQTVPLWDGSTFIDFAGMGINGITSISLTFSSTLQAFSEAGTTSHIQSSLVQEEILVGVFIPEPASIALLGIGGLVLGARRRR